MELDGDAGVPGLAQSVPATTHESSPSGSCTEPRRRRDRTARQQGSPGRGFETVPTVRTRRRRAGRRRVPAAPTGNSVTMSPSVRMRAAHGPGPAARVPPRCEIEVGGQEAVRVEELLLDVEQLEPVGVERRVQVAVERVAYAASTAAPDRLPGQDVADLVEVAGGPVGGPQRLREERGVTSSGRDSSRSVCTVIGRGVPLLTRSRFDAVASRSTATCRPCSRALPAPARP